ncbi:MAG TPA: hypothetical protein VJL35_01370 [Gemmatimonadaceae bacterium]|nr:hypothetical protein [Gemmatimonadaceae bacterium]
MLAALFAINLTVGAGEASCVTPMTSHSDQSVGQYGATSSMADMDMSMSTNGSDESRPTKPCDEGQAPVRCILAAGCTSAPVVVVIGDSDTLTQPSSRIAALDLVVPVSLRVTPEPPPPKA